MGNLFIHSKSLGKYLEKSMSEYNDFANVFNKILLRLKNMNKIGAEIGTRLLNNSLDTYCISAQSASIDSEAEDITQEKKSQD